MGPTHATPGDSELVAPTTLREGAVGVVFTFPPPSGRDAVTEPAGWGPCAAVLAGAQHTPVNQECLLGFTPSDSSGGDGDVGGSQGRRAGGGAGTGAKALGWDSPAEKSCWASGQAPRPSVRLLSPCVSPATRPPPRPPRTLQTQACGRPPPRYPRRPLSEVLPPPRLCLPGLH